MEDVIFAGTSGRPPLGRAEVILTIDNSDGALPIEYAEVTISRTMFRSGGSEYAINGTTVPAARRPGAAQRLRHRPRDARDRRPGPARHDPARDPRGPARVHRGGRRRPQAPQAQGEGAPQARLHRRQPAPARRPAQRDPPPAQAARPAGRGRPPGRHRAGRRPRREGPADGRRPGHRPDGARAGAGRRDDPGRAPGRGRGRDRRGPAEREAGPRGGAARGPAGADPGPGHAGSRSSGLRERLRGTQCLAAERIRNAAGAIEEAARVRAATPTSSRPRPRGSGQQEQEIGAEVEAHRAALEEAVTARRAAEDAAAEEERRVAGLQRAAADRREGLARLHGQVNALRSRAAAADDEIGRLGQAREEVLARAERAQHDFTALETRVAGLDAGEEGLDAEHEAAVAELDDLEERLAKVARGGPAGRPRPVPPSRPARTPSRWASTARTAPARCSPPPTRSPACSARSPRCSPCAGLRGRRRRRARLRRRRRGGDRRRRRRRRARPAQGRRPRPRRAAARRGPRGRPRLAGAARRARRTPLDVVECPDDLRPARWAGCCSRPPWSTTSTPPAALVAELPDVTAVTRDGDVLGAHFAAGGSTSTAQPDRDPGRARRGRQPSSREAVAAAERLGFDMSRLESRAAARRRSGSTSRWPSSTSPTPRSPRSPRSSASSAPRRGPPAARPSAWSGRSRRPRRRATTTSPGWPTSRRGSPRRRRPPTRSPTPTERERLAEAARPPGRPRWTPGWRCAPPRSGRARCTAGPTS